MEKYKLTKTFFILSAIFLTCCLASNIMAVKIISVFGITLTGAVLVFPITYILSDIFTEVYGYQKAKLVTWVGLGGNALMVLLLTITSCMPYPDFWLSQNAYKTVVGTTPRIFIAGLIAFLVGSLLNARVLSKLKLFTKGKHLWIRTITSTIVGEGVDTLIFVCIVFIGTLELNQLIIMIASQFIWKVSYEILFTPVTYWIIKQIKKIENIDTYDYSVKYTWFR